MDSFPPNSKTAKAAPSVPEPKKIERVTSGQAVRRKRNLGTKFKETFIGGDAKSASQYVLLSVIVPSAKDLLAEAMQTGIERLIYGESKTTRRSGSSMGYANVGRVNYQGLSNPASATRAQQRTLPRTSRTRHDFSDIIIQSRPDAEEVLDRMYALLDQYKSVLVADLYELTGIKSDHVDNKWGWTNLRGAQVKPVPRRGGYLLDLPDPQAFD